MEAVNLDAMLARFAEHWSPKKIAQINDYDVRIVEVQGEFTWHRHADTDEFFLVLDGRLTIQMRDRDVALGHASFSSCLAASSTARALTPRAQCSCSNQAAWSTPAMPVEN
jgi:Cupin domain